VTALSDIPIQGKMLIAAFGPRWCQHREEMIYTCTYSEMRILQLTVSGTLANAGRPERVINKQTNKRPDAGAHAAFHNFAGSLVPSFRQ
jgi:hypothetical protein